MLASTAFHTIHTISTTIHGLRFLAHVLPYWVSIPLGALIVFGLSATLFDALKGLGAPVPTGGICGGPTDPK